MTELAEAGQVGCTKRQCTHIDADVVTLHPMARELLEGYRIEANESLQDKAVGRASGVDEEVEMLFILATSPSGVPIGIHEGQRRSPGH